MRVLILGASGFIGSKVLQYIDTQTGVDCYALQHRRPLAGTRAKIIEGGIGSLTDTQLLSIRPDLILHLARPTFPRFRSVGRWFAGWYAKRVNTHFLQRVEKNLPGARVIYLSGSLMYGNSPAGQGHTEDSPLAPISFARKYIRTETPFVQAVVQHKRVQMIRVPWVLGAGSWFEWVYMNHFRKHGNIPLFGSGHNLMHFILLKDLPAMIWQYAREDKPVVNLFSPVCLTQKQFADMLCKHLGCTPGVNPGGYERDLVEAFESNIVLGSKWPEMANTLDLPAFEAEVKTLLSGFLKNK